MNNFDGISIESLMLLAQNRFENDRNFYEANKDKLKTGIINPMRQIAQALLRDMYEYDEEMVLDPVKMVSRIRRDTRYTRDKSLYRENSWIMFMRSKKINPYVPCFWFEISPNSYDFGVGTYAVKSRLMELYRNKINNDTEAFRKAVNACKSVGAEFYGDFYKKEKENNLSDDLKIYYSVKRFSFFKSSNNISDLSDESIIDKARETYKHFNLMYQFMLDVATEFECEESDLSVR